MLPGAPSCFDLAPFSDSERPSGENTVDTRLIFNSVSGVTVCLTLTNSLNSSESFFLSSDTSLTIFKISSSVEYNVQHLQWMGNKFAFCLYFYFACRSPPHHPEGFRSLFKCQDAILSDKNCSIFHYLIVLSSQCLFSLLIISLLCFHIICIEESENLFELRDIVLSESPLRVFVVEEDQQLKLQ